MGAAPRTVQVERRSTPVWNACILGPVILLKATLEERMSLLRSICCLFGGRCAEEERKPSTETMRGKAPGDLGQKEAERERASEDHLRHMESRATSTPSQGPH
jgi:hypothetical protein